MATGVLSRRLVRLCVGPALYDVVALISVVLMDANVCTVAHTTLLL